MRHTYIIVNYFANFFNNFFQSFYFSFGYFWFGKNRCNEAYELSLTAVYGNEGIFYREFREVHRIEPLFFFKQV
jgi:hypothetical protein